MSFKLCNTCGAINLRRRMTEQNDGSLLCHQCPIIDNLEKEENERFYNETAKFIKLYDDTDDEQIMKKVKIITYHYGTPSSSVRAYVNQLIRDLFDQCENDPWLSFQSA